MSLATQAGGAANAVVEATTGAVGLAWLIPLVPLAGFVVILALGGRLRERSAAVAITAALASFAVSVAVALEVAAEPATYVRPLATWLEVGELQVAYELLIDQLTVVMLLVVTGVGSLIHVYSYGYMHGDERFPQFFAYLNLFLFAMTVLVLGSGYLTMFLGWELVGLCSYLLVGFWFEEAANAAAAKKAFVTNRAGDLAMMVAFFVLFAAVGSLSFAEVFAAAGELTSGTVLAVGLLLLLGASAKSAQIPLFVWLPDAMAGPTPVSALIHAATMVTAGVYVLVRSSPLLVQSLPVLTTIAWIGVLTALVGALIALRQDDIKRVLAYSTISQLGYMVAGVGVAGFDAAIFHLTTHAFFKAALFLAAGAVMHALAERTDIWRMGGLWRAMPATAGASLVAVLAISGVPPLSGFWSKDQILAAAYEHGFTGIWVVGVLTVVLTGLYMGRWLLLVFWGRARFDQTRLRPHEAPPSMTAPLVALAVLSAAGGVLNLSAEGWLAGWLDPVLASAQTPGFAPPGPLGEPALIVVSTVAAVVGLAGAWFVYGARDVSAGRLAEPVRGWAAELAERGFLVDELYEAVFVRAGGRVARAAAWFDAEVIDGLVDGLGEASQATAGAVRRAQSGLLRSYAAGFVAGTVVLVAVLLSQVA